MSWNVAKRALTMGYRKVAWYPDGDRRLGGGRAAAAESQARPSRRQVERFSIQRLPDGSSEREYALLDGGWRLADVADRLAPILKDRACSIRLDWRAR